MTLTEQQLAEAVEAMLLASGNAARERAGLAPEADAKSAWGCGYSEQLPEAKSALTAALPIIERAVLERAAQLVETLQEGSGLHGKRVTAPRYEGNVAGLGYAAALRALAEEARG